MGTRSILTSRPLQFEANLYQDPTDLSDLSDDSGFGSPLGWGENTAIVFGRKRVTKMNKLTGYLNEIIEIAERFAIVTEQRNFDPEVLAMLYPHNFPTTSISTKPALSDNAGNAQRVLSHDTTKKILLAPKEVNIYPGALIYNAIVTTREDEHSIIHQIDTKFELPIAFEAFPTGASPEKVYQWRLVKDMVL